MDRKMRIELLGGMTVLLDGQEAPRFRSQKPPALLAYLAYFRQQQHPREVLIEMLWPDAEPEAGRNRLSVTLSRIRTHVGEKSANGSSVIQADRFHLWINSRIVQTDVQEMEDHLEAPCKSVAERIDHLRAAIDLVKGPILPGYYESWIAIEQERLNQKIQTAASELISLLESAGRPEEALDYAKRRVSAEPLREEAHRDLIRLLISLGRSADAVQQYRTLERLLSEGLDVQPDVETLALIQSIPKAETQKPATLTVEPVAELTQANGSRARKSKLRAWVAAVGVCAITALCFWVGPRRAANKRMPTNRGVRRFEDAPVKMPLWTVHYRPLADEGSSEPRAMTSDSEGNVYVTGFVKTKQHDVDAVTLKYSPEGKVIWRARYNGPQNDCERGYFIGLDTEGSTYVTADCYNGERAKSGTEWDVLTLKYDRLGKLVWAKRYNDRANADDRPHGMVIDRTGGIYVTGTTHTPDGKTKFVLFKYRPDGMRLWTVEPGAAPTGMNASNVSVSSAAITPDNCIVLTGHCTTTDSSGRKSLDMITFRYDRHGNLIWARRHASEARAAMIGMVTCADSAGNVYVAGSHNPAWRPFEDPKWASSEDRDEAPKPAGGELSVLVKYDPSGTELWSTAWPHSDPRYEMQPVRAIAQPSGDVYVLTSAKYLEGPAISILTRVDPQGKRVWSNTTSGLTTTDFVIAGEDTVVGAGEYSNGAPPANSLEHRVASIYCGENTVWRFSQDLNIGREFRKALIHQDRYGNLFSAGQTNTSGVEHMVLFKFRP